MDESGLLYVIRKIKAGGIIYADDTTGITDSKEKMHKLIGLLCQYCEKYDIIINEKKTQWMRLGDKVRESSEGVPIVAPAAEGEDFRINGQPLEKVDRFKLLGNWTMTNGKMTTHIKKRKQAAYAPLPGLNELGLNDDKTALKIKGTLIQTYVRPRLVYGTEAFEMNGGDQKELRECEGKIIKRALRLPKNA